MRDENTSARLSAKNAGGAYARGGNIFVGHYSTANNILYKLCTKMGIYF